MIKLKNTASITGSDRGAVAILTGISIFVLIGFAALAIDIGHLILVKGELQNGADAGALAGAQVLYSYSGGNLSINTEANTTAQNIAKDHLSDLKIVDVKAADVERGHWCFSCIDDETGKKGVFTANPSTNIVDLVGKTTEELDKDSNFINAVRVHASRTDTPALSFFATIFGFQNFLMSAHAVAYIGFAGELLPFEVDQPIAICKAAIWSDGKYKCNIGRMLSDNGDTAGWSDFTQPSSCPEGGGGVSDSGVGDVICKGNRTPIIFGDPLRVGSGVQTNNFDKVRECWSTNLKGAGPKTYPNRTTIWTLTLPVIDCGDKNQPKCGEVVGAVDVEVVWITPSAKDPKYEQVPKRMATENGGFWDAPLPDDTEENRKANWNNFADQFNLTLPNGQKAYWDNYYQALDDKGNPKGDKTYGYSSKTIYFKPSCTVHEPTGLTGGQNFGLLSKTPVLVK